MTSFTTLMRGTSDSNYILQQYREPGTGSSHIISPSHVITTLPKRHQRHQENSNPPAPAMEVLDLNWKRKLTMLCPKFGSYRWIKRQSKTSVSLKQQAQLLHTGCDGRSFIFPYKYLKRHGSPISISASIQSYCYLKALSINIHLECGIHICRAEEV